MWQGTGLTIKWRLSCYSPRVQTVSFGIRWFVYGGGARRQQWHFIPLPTRARRRWQIVWQDPRLGFVADTGRFVTMDTLVRFSRFCSMLPTSLIFSFLIPVCLSFSCSLVCAAAICYSQQVRILQYVFFLLVSFVSYLISKLSCFYLFCVFSWFYFSGGVFCCALVLGTLALDLPTLIISLLLFFSVSLSVTT